MTNENYHCSTCRDTGWVELYVHPITGKEDYLHGRPTGLTVRCDRCCAEQQQRAEG